MVAGILIPVLALGAMNGNPSPSNPLVRSGELTKLCTDVAAEAAARFGKDGLRPDLFSFTLVELDRGKSQQATGDYRGNDPYYPASVVKLFYLAYAHKVMQDGKLKSTPEFERAIHDMITESSNDATHAVLDYTTFTTGGPELPPKEFEAWKSKRNAVNRWYAGMGYEKVNACQKTWCEGPYGREAAFVGKSFENRNSLTSDNTARVMTEIALGRIVTPERCRTMLDTLKRKTPADDKEADFQARAFIGKSIPSGSELYSKAGYTSTSRHDVAYVKLPNGKEVVIAVYTHNNADKPDVIPFIAERLLARYLK
ncbi:MAG: serine hydrolase [Fimbriimonadaceae bacterium]|nr:serine hydrolase [Fimbriimonadaceae bacterium]